MPEAVTAACTSGCGHSGDVRALASRHIAWEMATMTDEPRKDSRSRSYVPFLPFSLFVLVQKDDGVMVVPPPGGAGVCGGSDREWMYESVGYNVCLLVLSAAEHSPRARSFDLEVTPWAPTRLTSCIFHPGPEESSGASTLEPAPTQLLQATFA